MDDDVIHGDAMRVVSLDVTTAGVPDLDGSLELVSTWMWSVSKFSLPSSELVTIHLPSQ